LAVRERKWRLRKNVRMKERCHEKKRRRGRGRERRIWRRCENGNVNENVSCCLAETKEQEGLHQV